MKKKEYITLKKEIKEFKKHLNTLINGDDVEYVNRKSKIKIYEQPSSTPPPVDVSSKLEDDGSVFFGDFDSEATRRTWNEFFWDQTLFGTGVAVIREIATWHGERKVLSIATPIPELKVPVSEDWKLTYIESGKKTSDYVNDPNLKSDDNGEYYEHNTGKQILKFYLPNTEFYNAFASEKVLQKFVTVDGIEFTLLLELKSQTNLIDSLSGIENQAEFAETGQKSDNVVVSLTNSLPDGGNGWYWKLGVDAETYQYPYFTKTGGSWVAYNAGRVLDVDTKSSFNLWWDHWGTTVQIILGIALAFFAAPLGLRILALATKWGWTAAEGFLAGTTFLGMEFSVPVHTLIAECLLEVVVNVPSAIIDNMYGNDYGAFLGIAFCFFPILIRNGKIAKIIDGYTDEAAQILGKKIFESFYSGMTQREFIKFLEKLSAFEKKIFSAGVKWLMDPTKSNPKIMQEFIEGAMKEAVEKGTFPSMFKRWAQTSGRSGVLTLGTGVLYWGAASGVYVLMKDVKKDEDDTRTDEQIAQDVSNNVEKLDSKFESVKSMPGFATAVTDIIDKYTDASRQSAGQFYYELSKGDAPSTAATQAVADGLWKELQDKKSDAEFVKGLYDPSTSVASKDAIEKINNEKTEPVDETEINSFFTADNYVTSVSLETLLSDSQYPFSSEAATLVEDYPCLKDNFDFIEGDGYTNLETGEESWFIKLKCKKEMKLSTDKNWSYTAKPGHIIYLFDNGDWIATQSKYENKYHGFKCP